MKDPFTTILADVKANLARLESCKPVEPAHNFVAVEPAKFLTGKYRCSYCGGEIGSREAIWYQHGMDDERRKHNESIDPGD